MRKNKPNIYMNKYLFGWHQKQCCRNSNQHLLIFGHYMLCAAGYIFIDSFPSVGLSRILCDDDECSIILVYNNLVFFLGESILASKVKSTQTNSHIHCFAEREYTWIEYFKLRWIMLYKVSQCWLFLVEIHLKLFALLLSGWVRILYFCFETRISNNNNTWNHHDDWIVFNII